MVCSVHVPASGFGKLHVHVHCNVCVGWHGLSRVYIAHVSCFQLEGEEWESTCMARCPLYYMYLYVGPLGSPWIHVD